jgi:predicted RNase H-like nuclease (RuvC/YqgF family)
VSTDAEQILRLRDRVGSLEHNDRELWRTLRRLEKSHGQLVELVDNMSEAEKIANAVTSAIRADRRRRFTLPRRLAGAGAAAILLVPALHDLVIWLSST